MFRLYACNIKTKSKVRAAARGSTSEKRYLVVDVGTIWRSPGRQARNTVVYNIVYILYKC